MSGIVLEDKIGIVLCDENTLCCVDLIIIVSL